MTIPTLFTFSLNVIVYSLAISISRLRMLRVCMKCLDNFCYLCAEVILSSQKKRSPHWLKHHITLLLVVELDTDVNHGHCIMHSVCNTCTINLQNLINGKKSVKAVCSAHDFERIRKSPNRLLFLYDITYSERKIEREKKEYNLFEHLLSHSTCSR